MENCIALPEDRFHLQHRDEETPLLQRIGIDVGGTNTDAVLMAGQAVVHWVKTPTTADVTTGIVTALQQLLAHTATRASDVSGVMIGTTHFTNAVVQRRGLSPVAAIRLALPATACIPPLLDWPDDLRQLVGKQIAMIQGGHEIDGRPIMPLDTREIERVAQEIKTQRITNVAVTSVFSPVDASLERCAAEILHRIIPHVNVTLSSDIGRIGLLERENAAVMNACLRPLGRTTLQAFRQALAAVGLQAPLFLTQNDGTLMSAAFAEQYPVLTFASGPTNSMRGAAFLTGVDDALVIDIGGTTADVGALVKGFPRPAAMVVEIGGVRTNFRMPDVYSFGLGGGSIVTPAPLRIGPESVGYALSRDSLAFGGTLLTASDIGIAAGLASFGEPQRLSHLDRTLVQRGLDEISRMVYEGIDRMKLSAAPVPLVAVGGGSFLVPEHLPGVSHVIRAPHYQVANAVGAAIAQISGEVDQTFTLATVTRDTALAQAKALALERTCAAGAHPDTVQIVDIEEIPLTYLPSNALRIRVKAVGELALAP
jgi:N-methylhydantoinase A/oxoprolinase/acetone carboxylase beta subunit